MAGWTRRAATAASLAVVLGLGIVVGKSIGGAEAGNVQIWQAPSGGLPVVPPHLLGKCPAGFAPMALHGSGPQRSSSYRCVSQQAHCDLAEGFRISARPGKQPLFDGFRFQFVCDQVLGGGPAGPS